MATVDDVYNIVLPLSSRFNPAVWVAGTPITGLTNSGRYDWAAQDLVGVYLTLTTVPAYYGRRGGDPAHFTYLEVGFVRPMYQPGTAELTVELGSPNQIVHLGGQLFRSLDYVLAPGVELRAIPLRLP